jgi:AcrR family transcriptional regulator
MSTRASTGRERDGQRRSRRDRNRRGEGGQLREEIVEAATRLLAELGDVHRLSLRSVAREVGIATTSIYLHFSDIEGLAGAVVTRAFAELDAERDRASDGIADPCEALLARCQAYCRFAIEHPGLYQVMFSTALPDPLTLPSPDAPGRRSFESLVRSIDRCQTASDVAEGNADELAIVLWAALHGLVSLRISRPRFPWPSLEAQVTLAVALIIGPRG